LRPNAEEREEINRIIMEELTYGIVKPEAVAAFQRVIKRMKAEGCDAVVLGCTEIPLLMNDANSPLPTLDSTRLLARRRCAGPREVRLHKRRGDTGCPILNAHFAFRVGVEPPP
jgi:aspartate/glutamate racemase